MWKRAFQAEGTACVKLWRQGRETAWGPHGHGVGYMEDSQQCVEQCFSGVVLREVSIRRPGYACKHSWTKTEAGNGREKGRNTSHVMHIESSEPGERWSVCRGWEIREESGLLGWPKVIGWNPVSLWWATACKGDLPRWSHHTPILPRLPGEEQRWKQCDWAMTSGGNSERAICVATVPPLLWRLLGNDNNSKREFGDVGPKFQCKELRVMVQKQRTEVHKQHCGEEAASHWPWRNEYSLWEHSKAMKSWKGDKN